MCSTDLAAAAAALHHRLVASRNVCVDQIEWRCSLQVRIEDDSPAIMLRGMGGSQIGVWCAHGEGQAHFPSEEVQRRVMADTLAPIRCATHQRDLCFPSSACQARACWGAVGGR